MDSQLEKRIDSIIEETNAKLEAIVAEMKIIKSLDIDDVTKHKKTESLRREFENVLNEQQEKVEKIMKQDKSHLK